MKFHEHLLLSLFVLIHASIISVTLVNGLEWILDDAVHLSVELETRSPDESGQQPVSRIPGKCVKLRECHPILFLTDRADNRDEPTSTNSDLIEYILESSDVCQPAEGDDGPGQFGVGTVNRASPGDSYVWCRLRDTLHKDSLTTSTKPGAPLALSFENKADDENSFCGQRVKASRDVQEEERVVGGTEITAGDAPYLVALTFRGKQVCGGSLIDEQHILTAAHCVSHLKGTVLKYMRILVGDHNIKDLGDVDHQERNVSKIIYHKEFSSDTLHDDIAMIKLSEPVQYTNNVSPICIHDGISGSIEEGTTNGKLIGWGQVQDGGDRPNTPHTAKVRIWRTEDCEDIYDGIVPEDIFEKALCAGGFQDGGTTDACRGDSGGPLLVHRNKREWQVGIVSFGIGCGRYPGVFTKTSEYQSWIDRHRTIILSNE